MSDEMTRRGIGLRFALTSAVYGLVTIAISFIFPVFSLSFLPFRLLAALSCLLFLFGFPIYLMTVKVARAAFRKGNVYMQMRDLLGTFFTCCR
jgi:hypothetical protein